MSFGVSVARVSFTEKIESARFSVGLGSDGTTSETASRLNEVPQVKRQQDLLVDFPSLFPSNKCGPTPWCVS